MFDEETDAVLLAELMPVLYATEREIREAAKSRWDQGWKSETATSKALEAMEYVGRAHVQALNTIRAMRPLRIFTERHLRGVQALAHQVAGPLPHLSDALDQWVQAVEGARRLSAAEPAEMRTAEVLAEPFVGFTGGR